MSAIVAICVWAVVFSPAFFRADRFWLAMTVAMAVLNTLSLTVDREMLELVVQDVRSGVFRKIAVGLASAFILYFIFFIGRRMVVALLPLAGQHIGGVYALGAGRSRPGLIAWLLLIGTGEELFWRHHLQRVLWARVGTAAALIIQAVVYAVVHSVTGNSVLVAAAGVAGLFWGAAYAKWRSPLLNVVSHAVWDVVIFVVMPLDR